MAGFSEWLFGSPDKLKKVDTGTAQQKALHNNILSQAMGMTQGGGGYQNAQDYYNSLFQPGNQAYENFAAPFMNQFQEQTLPRIAEQFAGAGALSSSGFGQALGGAASGLQAQLAQLFASLQSDAARQQTNQFNQLSQTGLNYQPFAYQNIPGSQGMLGPALAGIGSAFGAPLLGQLAGMAGTGIANLFKKPQKGTQLAQGPGGLYPTTGNYNPYTGGIS
jgi:hypothetical protein